MTTTLMVSEKPESTIEPVPEGLHQAACVGIYDVGTQYNERFDSAQRKVVITWELPDLENLEFEKDGVKQSLPRCISARYTLSLNSEANLRRILDGWRGRRFTDQELAGFDIAKLLGVPAQLQIMHSTGSNGRTYANVENVLPCPKGTKVTTVTEPALFSMATLDKPELPENLPAWIGKLAMESREWEKLTDHTAKTKPSNQTPEAQPERTQDDDVPF